MLKRIFFVVYLGFFLFQSSPLHAEFFAHPLELQTAHRGQFLLIPRTQLYYTESNFDNGGGSEVPNGLDRYWRLGADLTLRYGLLNRLILFGRLSWVYVQTDHSTLDGSSYGLPDPTFGLTVEFTDPDSFLRLWFQSQIEVPVYDNESAQADGNPYLGDGVLSLTGSFFGRFEFLNTPTRGMSLTLGSGFNYRDHHLPPLIPFSATFKLEKKLEGPQFGGKIHGVAAFAQDSNESLQIPAELNPVNGSGGIDFIDARSPNVIQAAAFLGHRFNPGLAILGEVGKSIWGKNAPNAWTFQASLEASLGWDYTSREGIKEGGKEYDHYLESNKGFLTYDTEGTVVKINDRMNLIKINKGSRDGVKRGDTFDIFARQTEDGPGDTIARAKVTAVRPEESALEIEEYFKEAYVEVGCPAKKLVK